MVAAGEYAVQIGRSATDIVAEATLTLAGDDVVPHLTLHSSVAEWFGHPVVGRDCSRASSPRCPTAPARCTWGCCR